MASSSSSGPPPVPFETVILTVRSGLYDSDKLISFLAECAGNPDPQALARKLVKKSPFWQSCLEATKADDEDVFHKAEMRPISRRPSWSDASSRE